MNLSSCNNDLRANTDWMTSVFDLRDLCGEASSTVIGDRELRDVLGCFATGVAVVTTRGEGGAPVGLTINSFNSVSLDPPLVLWSLSLNAPSLGAFRANGAFAVNILSERQANLARKFARPASDKFAGVDWEPGCADVPLIAGAAARLECRTWRRYEGGDHEIIIGEVIAMAATDKAPLIFHRGRFARADELR